ncbi:MAG TPA: T9SS type A sorting domain-containing protein [Bacteroidales bacterium]|nr:T9SS type A sorting domain-containing protein [Bacteroidales bacterium]
MLRYILVSVLITFTFGTLFSQHTNILIDDDGSWTQPEEPSIIVNPKNTDHMVGGANIDNVYYSTDGGYTWTTSVLSSTYGVWGDPVLIVDTAGAYYFFHLSNPQQGSWIDRIVCQKQEAIGEAWNNGTYMGLNNGKEQDKHWAIVDINNNDIFVTWTQFDNYGSSSPDDFSDIMFSRSYDGGETWSEAMMINEVSGDCVDDDNTVEGAVPALGPNGELYVVWAGPEGLVFDRSLDRGDTWLDEDIFVGPFPEGWAYDIPGISRCNGLPITKCDLSGGPNHGTIYVNWTDQRNGTDDTDVWMCKSTDGGDTWTEATRVNDDPPGKQQFFTWMDVDQVTGHLWFVFYDRRNYDNNNTDVYMALSRDGGESFINFKVSESPFLPYSSTFFGDYTNVSAYDNVVRPIWARLEGSDLSIWTAIVNPDAVGIDEDIPSLLSLEQNYPNPFRESTVISFKLRRPEEVSLKVYDVFGREVAVIHDHEYLKAGKHTRVFEPSDYSLSPGMYYFSLENENSLMKKKMIFVR